MAADVGMGANRGKTGRIGSCQGERWLGGAGKDPLKDLDGRWWWGWGVCACGDEVEWASQKTRVPEKI